MSDQKPSSTPHQPLIADGHHATAAAPRLLPLLRIESTTTRRRATTRFKVTVFIFAAAFLAIGAAHAVHRAVRRHVAQNAKHRHSGERPWHRVGGCEVSHRGAVPPLQPPSAIDAVIAVQGDDAEWMTRQGFRRIALSETDERWMAEDQIIGLLRQKIHFMDVTDRDLESVASLKAYKAEDCPTSASKQSVVLPIAGNVSVPALTSWLTELSTSFKTRYYQSPSGAKASQWIFDQAKHLAKKAAANVKVSVKQFEHPWPQSSVIARIEGEDAADAPVVVLSAHLDSVNHQNPWFGQSPGADDDGSGSATIFESFQILMSSGFVPKRPIEFHWYAGEEGSLLGSQKSDMTGYFPSGETETIAVMTDFVDPALTRFLKALVETYAGVGWTETSCGFACSDHASWTKVGFPSAFMFESEFPASSPYVHTPVDDVSNVSFEHMAKFTKLAIAFAVEMSLF
ncbi:hypothetical protein DFJ73DRAFT_957727 [Zopfochytrium polystomum]|nr:hypothetical protein DFJ73DRAFT_957727 [Zopfochytrium polystomum]